MRPATRYAARGSAFIRQWRVLVLLRRERLTFEQLADRLGCSTRTIRRDLHVLQAVPLPLTENRERAGRAWVVTWALASTPAWPRCEETPLRDIT